MKETVQERSEQLVEQLARRIEGWRLALPSLLFLEVLKPFSFIASQGLLLCQPVLDFFDRDGQVADYADLLADRSNLDDLIARLEHEKANRGEDGPEED